jgi:hypothetical protein
MFSLSTNISPDCAERTSLISQTSLKPFLNSQKKWGWPLVISSLDLPNRSRLCFRSLTPVKLLG